MYYTYDSAGRVTQVHKGNLLIRRYFYDPTHGWLTREDNYDANRTYVYTYDNCGNILNRKSYLFSTAATDTLGTPLNTKTWNYQSTALGKEYLSYEFDSYDAIGNPEYINYSTYTWDGRLLTRIQEDGGDFEVSYSYDADGIRTAKTIKEYDSETYVSYTLDGTTILGERRELYDYDELSSIDVFFYYYDESGSPIGLCWNNTNYYYYKNIFGDVLGIMNDSGTMVVRYAYDAWGNIISTTGTMSGTLGRANPFRYRSYYYDTDTGYYYLQSRYYDPSTCRFINIDGEMDIASAAGCNLYAYCLNDPMNHIDPTGNFAISIAIAGFACIAALCVACVMLIDPNVQAGLSELGTAIENGIEESFENIETTLQNLRIRITTKQKVLIHFIQGSLARAKKELNWDSEEKHHIVAKKAHNAKLARDILTEVGIDYDGVDNIILLKKPLHRRLHTNFYYGCANAIIISAYRLAGDDKEQQKANVKFALTGLRAFLEYLNEFSWA